MLYLLKFLTGFLLAIAILFGAGVGATRYLIGRLSIPPERPSFDNETAEATQPIVEAESSSPAAPPIAEPPAETPTETPSAAAETPEPDSDTYQAKVTQPIGLILREEPGQDSRQITGLEYNTEITVLTESDDGQWLRVKLPGSNIEGWIKSGNTEQVAPPTL